MDVLVVSHMLHAKTGALGLAGSSMLGLPRAPSMLKGLPPFSRAGDRNVVGSYGYLTKWSQKDIFEAASTPQCLFAKGNGYE